MPERRNILITGASSGIGEGMAREFAARGRNLALCARRTDRLESLRAELQSGHPRIRVAVRPLDVTKHDDVFTTFRALRDDLGGTIDRVVVNAGLGKGHSIGTGYFYANKETVETNLLGALAQCEAALEIFRRQNDGHLVAVSSISALRGMRRHMTAYAASKAGLANLAEGIRSDLAGTPIRVTTLFPGYIESEMTRRATKVTLMVDNATGSKALVRAIEREPARAFVPAWPWAPISLVMRLAPLSFVRRYF